VTSHPLHSIQEAISSGEYDVTVHAVEEMAEDGLDIFDIECALMNGELTKTEADDPRGTKYTVIRAAVDGRTRVGVVGRFKETGIFLIITVYEAGE
jgi:Domain of unknown function (DUF4258)